MPGRPLAHLRYLPTRASGQVAVAAYVLEKDEGSFVPLALDVLTLDGARVAGITAFRTPEVFVDLGLPLRIPASPRATFEQHRREGHGRRHLQPWDAPRLADASVEPLVLRHGAGGA
jgi:hypothetical protein